jgi:hypothetical protein
MGLFLNTLLGSGKRVIDPLSIDGCTLWLDATTNVLDAANNPVTLNGAAIAKWKDRTSNGYEFTQTTAIRRPTYSSNSLNGLPGISFDGSQAQILDGGTTVGNLENKCLYIALVHKFNIGSPTGFFENVISKSGGYPSAPFTPGGWRIARWDYQAAAFTPSTYAYYHMRYDANGNFEYGTGNHTTTSATYTLFSIPRSTGRTPFDVLLDINNTRLASVSVNDNNTNYNTNHRLTIGGSYIWTSTNPYVVNPTTPFYGDVYEIIFYQRNSPLKAKEITGLSQYIKRKWGI